MDRKTHFCPTRRDLEEQCGNLVARLCESTTRLVAVMGQNHKAFLQGRAESQQTREELTHSRRQLKEHRTVHGC